MARQIVAILETTPKKNQLPRLLTMTEMVEGARVFAKEASVAGARAAPVKSCQKLHSYLEQSHKVQNAHPKAMLEIGCELLPH